MFRYCGNYRIFLSKNGFDTEEFLESLPVDYVKAVKIILDSQMWSVFAHEREELLKQGKLDECVLVKTGYNLWHANDLTVKCTKCGIVVTSDAKIKGGKIFCSPCFLAKSDGHCKFFILFLSVKAFLFIYLFGLLVSGKLKKFKTFVKRGSSFLQNEQIQSDEKEKDKKEKLEKEEITSVQKKSGSNITQTSNEKKKPPLVRRNSGPAISPRSSATISTGGGEVEVAKSKFSTVNRSVSPVNKSVPAPKHAPITATTYKSPYIPPVNKSTPVTRNTPIKDKSPPNKGKVVGSYVSNIEKQKSTSSIPPKTTFGSKTQQTTSRGRTNTEAAAHFWLDLEKQNKAIKR